MNERKLIKDYRTLSLAFWNVCVCGVKFIVLNKTDVSPKHQYVKCVDLFKVLVSDVFMRQNVCAHTHTHTIALWFSLVLWHINHFWLFIAKSFLYISIRYKWFDLVLWHINHCCLFNAKSFLYIFIKYRIYKHYVDNIFKQA